MGLFYPFTFAKVFMLLGVPYWIMRAFFRKDLWLFLLPFKSWISLTMLFLIAGYLLSLFNLTDPEYAGIGFFRVLSLYVAALWIGSILRDKRHLLYWLLVAIALSSAPNALGGVYELITQKPILKHRASGTAEVQAIHGQVFGGENFLGGGAAEGGKRCISFQGGGGENAMHSIVYMAIAALLPFIVKSLRLRLLALSLVGLNMINVLATGSRTGMIGLMTAIIFFLAFIEMRRKWLVIAGGIVGFLLAAVIFDLPLARIFLNRGAGAQGTIDFRILQWQTAWTMFERHPILGVGPGNFMTEYHRYHYDFPSHDKVLVVGPLHNAILNQMAESGLIGLFLLLMLMAAVLLTLYIVRVRSPDPFLRNAAVAVMAAFAGWSAGLLFYPSFLDEQGWILMGIAMGLWGVHQKVLKESSSPEESRPRAFS